MNGDLLQAILTDEPPPFALLRRACPRGTDRIDVLLGDIAEARSLSEIDTLCTPRGTGARHDVLALVPYRQIAERGFDCVDDGEPLLLMKIRQQDRISTHQALSAIPVRPISVTGGRFDLSDREYGDMVRRILADEIGKGVGANFVAKRSYFAEISDYRPQHALTLFRRLLEAESGAYWTFLVHTGTRTFVGATPEQHLNLDRGVLAMNPISGTYRYPDSGPSLPGILDFLSDLKESDELYMVVDEELKMMAGLCESGGRLVGPYLKEMSKLAHTEYFIEGNTIRRPADLLRQTMFAPTVVGSPLESACRVISRYEPTGRGYYSGVIALIGEDEHGGERMDSAILIRAADIDADGRMKVAVGATIVRHSDPDSEAAETRAKASAVLAALGAQSAARFADHPEVVSLLNQRNERVSRFWRKPTEAVTSVNGPVDYGRILVVDAEDTFTAMLGHQLRTLGAVVTIRRFDEDYDVADYDLVVMGPGPGDPRAASNGKIAALRRTLDRLLHESRPFLAVCLSHQVLGDLLGMRLARRVYPNQGVQRPVDLFGSVHRVGFYNSFSVHSGTDTLCRPGMSGQIQVSRDATTGEVHALRGPGFYSVQFHPESVLTLDGEVILARMLSELRSGAEVVSFDRIPKHRTAGNPLLNGLIGEILLLAPGPESVPYDQPSTLRARRSG
ncbi:anthranilate synthase family protein [Nocardia jejuensis]|uniref:anthranilate synthase family protein n=1 Tax=Nocardia jejuensis TaxID=328049 RepID=UPI000832C7FD|nr:anthranilate synthase family protein [Nocardia jejuensis]